jgi:hypothetical protein
MPRRITLIRYGTSTSVHSKDIVLYVRVFYNAFSMLDYNVVSNGRIIGVMNDELERIWLEGLRKTTEKLSQDSQCPSHDSN